MCQRQPLWLVAVLASVIIDHIPQTVGVSSPLAAEKDRVVGRGDAATQRQASSEGIGRLSTGVQYARAARPAGGSGGGGEDAVRQVIRAVGRGDVVAHHAPLAGG